MVKYRVPQSEIDERNKTMVLDTIRYYTFNQGGLDLDKLDPEILARRIGINLADAKKAVQVLISEGKVEVV